MQKSYDILNDTPTYGYVGVNCSTAQSIVYAALRFDSNPNDPIEFMVTAEDGNVYSAVKNAPSDGFAIGKFYTSTINVKERTYEPGIFSVSATKKVWIAPGNLIKTDSENTVESGEASYKFEAVSEMGQTNNGSLGYGSTPTATSARGYFTWDEILRDGETSDSPREFTVNGVSGWRVLTNDEWIYLIDTRTMNTGVSRYYRVTSTLPLSNPPVTFDGTDYYNVYGLLLPPDGATGDDVAGLSDGATDVDITTYLNKGFVFLPAAGYYFYVTDYSNWNNAGDIGYYWSTTQYLSSNAYDLIFDSGYVSAGYYGYYKFYYASVRLARDI